MVVLQSGCGRVTIRITHFRNSMRVTLHYYYIYFSAQYGQILHLTIIVRWQDGVSLSFMAHTILYELILVGEHISAGTPMRFFLHQLKMAVI